MEQIDDYPFEFTQPLQLCFDLMNKCNIGFFDESVNFLKKYWRFGYIIPFIVINYLSMTAYMSRIFTGQVKIAEFAFMVPVYLVQMQGFLKIAILIPRKCDVAQLVRELGTMWRLENLTDVQVKKKNDLLKMLKLSHAVFYWVSVIATYLNIMTPLLRIIYRQVLNQDFELNLPFGSVFPFDPTKNWYIYLATYAFQTYTMLRVVYLYIGTEFLLITLSAHLTTEFALLREDLLRITPTANGDPSPQSHSNVGLALGETISIQLFICRHQILIQLSNKLNNIFNRMIFVDLLFVTAIMCFFGFGATVAHGTLDKANNYIAVLALMFPIYVLCYYGELLKGESSGLAESAYESIWYNGGTHYQKIISYIIMRSQRPCCLTSLGFKPITLNTFTKVVSSTWSYISLAISVYSEE